MEPINLIVTALAGGAAAGAKATTNEAVKDAYKGLVSLVKKKFQGKSTAEMVLVEHKKEPETWEAPLKSQLKEVDANKDEEIINAAKKLMELVNPKGSADGKYNINSHSVENSLFGDKGTVNNNYGVNPFNK